MNNARGVHLPELPFDNEPEDDEAGFREENVPRPQVPSLPRYASLDRTALPGYRQDVVALSSEHMRRYLLFLGSVDAVKKAIVGLPIVAENVATRLDGAERWSLCVQMAVHRYGLWQKNMLGRQRSICSSDCTAKAMLPPFDVLMVWAAYLQCPSRYLQLPLLRSMIPSGTWYHSVH